jgi:hypothetical protein
VGSKQLKKNSVTTSKIKNGAVTGAKVDLSTLGKVPDAARADNAEKRQERHQCGERGESRRPFEHGAENLISGTEFVRVGFYKDLSGIVHLQGQLLVSGGSSAFTLPVGFRPQKSEIFDGMANEGEGGQLRIDPDGKVQVFEVFEPSLASVMFRTD